MICILQWFNICTFNEYHISHKMCVKLQGIFDEFTYVRLKMESLSMRTSKGSIEVSWISK